MKVREVYILKNGEELIVESPTLEDAEAMTEQSNKERLETRNLSRGPLDAPYTLEGNREGIEWFNNEEKSCLVVARYKGKIVGSGHVETYTGKVRYKHRCEIDLGILKDFWGLGIGGRIMKTLIDFAEKTEGLEQIVLNVYSENKRAIEMYKSFGFEVTGIDPKIVKFEDGTYGDYVSMIKWLKQDIKTVQS